MITVKLDGGLGNQMFQYAYALSLSNHGYDVKICPGLFYKRKFPKYNLQYYNISLDAIKDSNTKNNIFRRMVNRLGFSLAGKIKEKEYFYSKLMLQPKDNNCIYGYFQSEKYFLNVRNVLLKEFRLKNDISEYGRQLSNEINNSFCSCSLHIRRGDYLTNSAVNKIHGVLDLDYYKRAVKLLEGKQGNIRYFIFSDDIQWVKKNLNIKNAFFVDSPEKRIPNEDILLMSLCNHNIIANSSFSWWGAWLNNNNKKVVISPIQWLVNNKMNNDTFDLIPSNWIRI